MTFPAGLRDRFGFEDSAADWLVRIREIRDTALDQTIPDGHGQLIRTVVENHPAAALLGAVQGADLLVVGSRGPGGSASMLLGAVSAHVVAQASCTVGVVRHPGAGSGDGWKTIKATQATDTNSKEDPS